MFYKFEDNTRVTIPVRHKIIGSNCCLFELQNICQFIKDQPNNKDKIICPKCKSSVNISDFGIDFLFYHILSQIISQNLDNEQYQKNEIYYSTGSKNFYALKIHGSQKTKILGINCTQGIPEALPQKLHEIQNILLKQVENCLGVADGFGFSEQTQQDIKMNALQIQNEIMDLIQTKMGLNHNGKDSLTEKFCFSLRQGLQPKDGSLLVTWHPGLYIWHQYQLKQMDGNNFFCNQSSLGLKSIVLPTTNQVFLLGGFQDQTTLSTSDFFEISFIKDALDKSQEPIVVEKLPSLPYKCSQPMGVCDSGKIYLLGGTQYLSHDKIQMNSNVHVYEDGQWSQSKVQLPNPRVDGTVHFNKKLKFVALIGGYRLNPDLPMSQQNKNQEQVSKIDILTLKDYKCKVLDINLGLPNDRILVNKSMTVEIDDGGLRILIFNGNNQIQNIELPILKPQVFNMDYVLNQKLATLKQNEFIKSYQLTDTQSHLQIHDYEGEIINDTFYMMANCFKSQSSQIQTQSYAYNLLTGKCKNYAQATLESSMNIANNFLTEKNIQDKSQEKTPFVKLQGIKLITEAEFNNE